jgi:hypothetical protein
MLAPEFIVFTMTHVMVLVWTILKVLVNHLIDADSEPPRCRENSSESRDQLQRAA